MKTTSFFVRSLLVSFVALSGAALHADQAVVAAKTSAPVAKIGNTILTEDDMRKDMGMSLYEAENSAVSTSRNSGSIKRLKTMLFEQAAKEAGLSLRRPGRRAKSTAKSRRRRSRKWISWRRALPCKAAPRLRPTRSTPK